MIKTRRTKRTFSPEFKLEAIEQVVKYQRDVREVALALEINPDHLCKFFTVNSLPATILAMNMERVFTQIDTNERNVFHDSSPNESLSSA